MKPKAGVPQNVRLSEWLGFTEDAANTSLKPWNEILLKPGVSLEPDIVSRTGVWQRYDLWPMITPREHYFGNAS